MIRFLGYIILIVGLAGIIFFINYKGSAIPLPALWFVCSFFIMATGMYFIVKRKFQDRQNQLTGSDRLHQLNQLKLTGEKIKVTLDNSEVKCRSYQTEISNISFPTRTEIMEGLYDWNKNIKMQESKLSYIVFYKQYGDKTYKYISKPTAQSEYRLREYLNNRGGVDLYIDKANPGNYFFDLAFV